LIEAAKKSTIERRVATPRADLWVIKIGDRYQKEAVSPKEKASGVLARVGKVMNKPGTDRKRVFRSISGRSVPRGEHCLVAPRKPPGVASLLKIPAAGDKPIALVLAGHNGSGKSTLWYDRLADGSKFPCVNADRLTLSLLPPVEDDQKLKPWAERLRDEDERWQKLSQDGVQLFMGLRDVFCIRDRVSIFPEAA
jgi:hypothetical protein